MITSADKIRTGDVIYVPDVSGRPKALNVTSVDERDGDKGIPQFRILHTEEKGGLHFRNCSEVVTRP